MDKSQHIGVEPHHSAHCCRDFTRATESGTDNEMFGALIHWRDGEWWAGCIGKPIKFCPWCAEMVIPE